jgi:O-antigen ligase/tetratricopeptide (TPR) repeat protein
MPQFISQPRRAEPRPADLEIAGRYDAPLLKIVDGGLAAVIFLVPWIMGGRDEIGQLALAVLAVFVALAWTVRQSLRGSDVCRPIWAVALVFAGAIFLLLQTIPLPNFVMEWASPRQVDILPLWNSATSESAPIGVWSYLSMSPAETRAALVMFLSYGLLFLVTSQRVRSVEDVERILRWCAISAIVMASFGIVQLLAGNGKFFWLVENPYTDTRGCAKGSFTNRNHYAHFLALGIGPLIWWLHHSLRQLQKKGESLFSPQRRAEREWKPQLLAVAVAVVLFAGALSLSRGGMGVICLAAAVAGIFCFKSSLGKTRSLLALAAVVVLIASALSIFGLDRVVPRIESAMDISGKNQPDWSGSRFALWKTVAKAVPDSFWLGTGAGSFSDVYPIYEDGSLSDGVRFTHAENSYLHNLLENGLFGFVLALTALGFCGYWCLSAWNADKKTRTCAGAIAASLAACAGHALVDFVWYVPACVAMMVMLGACAMRLHRFSSKSPKTPATLPRWIAFGAVVLLIPAGAWMIHNRVGPAMAEPYWNRYLVARRAMMEAEKAKNSEKTADRLAAGTSLEAEGKLVEFLKKAISWDPSHSEAHLALAETHLRLFEAKQKNSPNRMNLVSIRDAALNSPLQTREALHRWLARAVGPSLPHLTEALEHCRRSLALRPLQGHAYVYLAKLGFLEGSQGLSKKDCLRQATLLRPFNGGVLYAVAAETLLDGDVEKWLELAKRAYSRSRVTQRQISEDLVARTPPEQIQEMIDFILANFQPDREGLEVLNAACEKVCPPERLLSLRRARAEAAEYEAAKLSGPKAASLWQIARNLYSSLGDGQLALNCARNAMQNAPNEYWTHAHLASCLLEQKLYAEAESELNWCRLRKPNDKNLELLAKAAVKGKLKAERADADHAKSINR